MSAAVTQMVKEGQLVDAEWCVCVHVSVHNHLDSVYICVTWVQPGAVFSIYFVFLVEEMVHRLLTGNMHHAQIIAFMYVHVWVCLYISI